MKSEVVLFCFFSEKMACHEQPSNHNEREGDHQDDPQTHHHWMIHGEIMVINERGEPDPYQDKNDPADQFPFPGDNQDGDQDVTWDEVDEKTSDLLPYGQPGIKRIECKHADEEDRQDTDYPWNPIDNFNCCGHDFNFKG